MKRKWTSFNINIIECKYQQANSYFQAQSVLI